jgi:soluble lytic murein transglycosylase
MRFLTALLLLLAPLPAFAQQADIAADIAAGNFAAATQAAAASGDPLLAKLVTFFRILSPGGGTADEAAAFAAANPDWPEQGLLALRAGTAPPSYPTMTPPFLAQATALHAAGQDAAAAALWMSQGPGAAAAADDSERAKFWPAQNTLARALLATGDAKDALAVVTAVAPPDSGDMRQQAADRDFLAGFIALRFLHNPAEARLWFAALAADSGAVITQARAYYWLGRAEHGDAALTAYRRAAAYPDTFYGQLAAIALGDSPSALAARIAAAGEPTISPTDALNFALQELPRAAVLLRQMGDTHDAAIFLNRLGVISVDDRARALAAKLALGLGVPQSAVAIARTAGTNGQMLVREGWPMPVDPPSGALEPAIAFGIMRQESSFDPAAISGSGARGLMQLMPATARLTARQNSLADDNLFDPSENMALGTTYLAGLVQQFGNCLPLAFAAYNAGPNNVANWQSANGDPLLGTNPGGADIVDWIELIPFSETRNYVQRVTESVVIYRALTKGAAEDPIIKWQH